MSSILDDIRRQLAGARADLFRRYPIRRLALFGSIVRGDDRPDSDVDIMVEFSEPVGLEIVDLAIDLEKLIGRRVDLVTRRAIRDRLRPYIERDLVYV